MSTRREILERLAAGEIDINQATEMLNGELSPDLPPDPPPAPLEEAPHVPLPPGVSRRRWLHIHINDLESGKNRIRVNVPLGLVQFGLKIGSGLNPGLQDLVDTLQSDEVSGTLVEVENNEQNERVHIFVD